MIANWKKLVISPNSTIRNAWRVLDREGLRIVLVVDEKNKLLGTVTDGDVRRGLLANVDIEDPVTCVVNVDPVVVDSSVNNKELIRIMEDSRLLALPVVENGILVGVGILQELLDKPKLENPVFIMAGGFGTRLRPLTDNCPKPMLKIGDKPILEIAINELKKSGFINFFISTHYMPEVIKDYFGDGSAWDVDITYVHEEIPLGTGGALGLLPDSISELPLILMNGDILTNIEFDQLLSAHNLNEADATVCIREYEYQVPFGVVNKSQGFVSGIEEKPIQRFSVNAGIYVVGSKLRGLVNKNQNINMPSLMEKAIENNVRIGTYPVHEYWLDIGRMDDYRKAQEDVLKLNLGSNI